MTTERPVALVTGASAGIGRAIATNLGATHHVIVGGRDADRVANVVGDLPSAQPWVVDLDDLDGLAGRLPDIDRLDVLVNSAGVAIERPFADLTVDDWESSFRTNVFAVARLTQLVLPALRRAGGLVVLLNSGSGLFSYANGSAYCGTKFALGALGDCLRIEERPNGVRVSSIHPGFVDTPMGRRLIEEMGHSYDPRYFVTPEAVAQAVRLAVDTPASAQLEVVSIRPMVLPGD